MATLVVWLVMQLVIQCHHWQCNQLWPVMTSCMTLQLVAWPVFIHIMIYKKVLNQASGSVSFLSSSWTCATSQSRDTPSTGTFSSLSLLWYLRQRSAAAVTAPSCCCCCKCRWSSMSSSLQGGTNAVMMCSLPEPTPFYYTCDWSCNQSWQSVIGNARSHGNLRLVVQPIVAICDWLYNQL